MPSAILWVEGIMLPGRPCDGEGQISAYACLFAFAMSFLWMWTQKNNVEMVLSYERLLW